MDELQDLILSTKKRDDEKLFAYSERVNPIKAQAIEMFISFGGTIEKVKGEVHAVLDGYKGREPYRDYLDHNVSEFLSILRWATTRLNDKLYHAQ